MVPSQVLTRVIVPPVVCHSAIQPWNNQFIVSSGAKSALNQRRTADHSFGEEVRTRPNIGRIVVQSNKLRQSVANTCHGFQLPDSWLTKVALNEAHRVDGTHVGGEFKRSTPWQATTRVVVSAEVEQPALCPRYYEFKVAFDAERPLQQRWVSREVAIRDSRA
jgi:hypothetical protein